MRNRNVSESLSETVQRCWNTWEPLRLGSLRTGWAWNREAWAKPSPSWKELVMGQKVFPRGAIGVCVWGVFTDILSVSLALLFCRI